MDFKKPDFKTPEYKKPDLNPKKTPEKNKEEKSNSTNNSQNTGNDFQLASKALGQFGQAMGHFAEANRINRIYEYIDTYYKKNGSYLPREYQEIFDTILFLNNIKLGEYKKEVERKLAFHLINSPETKNTLENFNLSIDTREVDWCIWGIPGPYEIFKYLEERYLKYKETEAKKICERAKIKVNEDYKKNGFYLEKKHKEILDTVLSINKIKLNENQRKRIERQLAMNLLINPEYKKTFETTDFTITKNNNNPNKSVIENINEVFSSVQQRLPDEYSNFLYTTPGKYKEDFIRDLRCSALANAAIFIDNHFKLKEQKRRSDILEKIKKEQLEKEKQERLEQERKNREQEKLLLKLKQKMQNRLYILLRHMNPEVKESVIKSNNQEQRKLELEESIKRCQKINEENKKTKTSSFDAFISEEKFMESYEKLYTSEGDGYILSSNTKVYGLDKN